MALWELYEVCAVIPVKITLEGNQSNKIPYIGDFEDCPFLWEPEVSVIDFSTNQYGRRYRNKSFLYPR